MIPPELHPEDREKFETWYADDALFDEEQSIDQCYGLWLGGRCLIRAQRAEIAALKESLSGRTVSCSNCNDIAKENAALKAECLSLAEQVEKLDSGAYTGRAIQKDFCDCKAYQAEKKRAEKAEQECARLSDLADHQGKEALRFESSLAASRAECQRLRSALEAGKKLAYEIEGGNRWPVVWDDDTKIMPALKAFKDLVPIPEWKRNGSGFKRADLSPSPGREGKE